MAAPPVAIVTGGNRGLGLETARRLAARGARVVAGVRREAERRGAGEAIGPGARVLPLDAGDPESISAFAARLREEGAAVEALVNNAGVYLERPAPAAARESMAVNALGPLRLTDALEPLLVPGARVVMVSSVLGQLSALPPAFRERVEGLRSREDVLRLAGELLRAAERGDAPSPYAVSKAALNAVTRILAAELAARGVLVNSVCPGWARTGMGGRAAPRSVDEGAAGIVWAATLPAGGPTGGFFRDGSALPW